VQVKAANVPLQMRIHGKGLFTQLTLERLLPGVPPANVVLYVRRNHRRVGAEATEQKVTVRGRHEPLPDASDTFHPQLHALRVRTSDRRAFLTAFWSLKVPTIN
jgi:hypothetical protein